MTLRMAIATVATVVAGSLGLSAACAPLTPQQEAKVAKIDQVVERVLAEEQKLCLAANFIPGTPGAVVKTDCGITEEIEALADKYLQQLEAHRGMADAGLSVDAGTAE